MEVIFGIYEREEEVVYIEPLIDTTKDTLGDIIKEKVTIERTIYSNRGRSYIGLKEEFKDHQVVDHGGNEYKGGKAYINRIEGFWDPSLTNMGTYKGIKKKNWKYYLKEMEIRYNYRNLDFGQQVDKIIKILMREPE